MSYHIPVMPDESEKYLINKTDGIYIDCTLGGGGHSGRLLSKHPDIRIVALDCDKDAISESKNILSQFEKRISFVRENFRNIKAVVGSLGLKGVDGILADLGISSFQVDNRDKGFSFSSGVLDMRMDDRLGLKAEDVLDRMDEFQLADIFYEYGEERASRPIARAIVAERQKGVPLTPELLCSIAARVKGRKDKINPATKVFQALRIFVNKELESLEELLKTAPEALNKGGRLVIISYHSLEDRLVKNSFRELAQNGIYSMLTKKVVTPSDEELASNSRSRSAKLRAVERK